MIRIGKEGFTGLRPGGETKKMGSEHKVWIVQHDESPHNTVLGVFASSEEAEAFADEVQHQFENGVIYSSFKVGYRFDDGSAQYGSAEG